MDASRLTISPEKLRFERITRAKKAQLRRQNVVDLINSKSYGYLLTPTEVSKIASLSVGGAQLLLASMVKKGTLTRHDVSPRKAFYTVNTDVRVVKPAQVAPVAETPKDSTQGGLVMGVTPPPAATKPEPASEEPQDVSHAELLRLSKDFAWENNSDSLREFVAWVANRG